ncbi:MAG: hypothetical protein ACP5D7_02090 [Limnospira sp.]
MSLEIDFKAGEFGDSSSEKNGLDIRTAWESIPEGASQGEWGRKPFAPTRSNYLKMMCITVINSATI